MAQDAVDDNVEALTVQVKKFFDTAVGYAQSKYTQPRHSLKEPRIVNNLAWLSDMGLLSFMRFPGKFFKVNQMLARDSVKSRLVSEQGISFAEFSYQLLQAYDFYTLNAKFACDLQIGGSDQWGNIVSGVDLIKRSTLPTSTNEASISEPAFGLTIPLLTTSSGEKFGKSAGNAIWLDAQLTTIFDFYQAGRTIECFPNLTLSLVFLTGPRRGSLFLSQISNSRPARRDHSPSRGARCKLFFFLP